MFRGKLRQAVGSSISDDTPLLISRRDFTGGANTRQHASKIAENQVESIVNFDVGILGQVKKINGTTLIEDLGSNAGVGAFGFLPRAGTSNLMVVHGSSLSRWTGSGSFAEVSTAFTSGTLTTMVKATCSGANGDVLLVCNGVDNCYQMLQDYSIADLGDTNTDCPITSVVTFFRNRVWALKANLLYWSDALPTTYDGKFDRTSNNYNITVGEERAVIGLRDIGLICLGSDAVYGINPSIVPAATDKPEKILDIGCVAGRTAVLVGDDVYFLSSDGVRGVFRTQQDKLQAGQTFPLSYSQKNEFDIINWSQISKACAVYFDNKYILALPTSSSSYNNRVWVYYPAIQSWQFISGWNVGAWAKFYVGGEERLYYIDSNDGSVYRAFSGTNNAGSAITSTMIGREEDLGYPMNFKSGGELEIEAQAAGSGNSLSISIAKDGGDFSSIGTMLLESGTSPTLPVALPFALADTYVLRKKFHLDSLGKFKTIQIQASNSDDNTDDITIYAYNIVSYLEQYENE